jgi:dihydrofolate reductase
MIIERYRDSEAAMAHAAIRSLLDDDLVDEMTLLIFPVVVGQGTRLFPDTGPEKALDLVENACKPRFRPLAHGSRGACERLRQRFDEPGE